MTVYVLDSYFLKIKTITSYSYLSYECNCVNVTQFTIKIHDVEKYKFMLSSVDDYFILFDDKIDREIGKIDDYLCEADEETGEKTITLSGRLSKFLLQNRINEQNRIFKMVHSVDIIKDLIEKNIKIKDAVVSIVNAEDIRAKTELILQKKIGYDNLYDIIYSLSQKDKLCIKFDFEFIPKEIYSGFNYSEDTEDIIYTNVDRLFINIYRGADRTAKNKDGNKKVILDYDKGHILLNSYRRSNIDETTFILVAGEDIGDDRKIAMEQINFIYKKISQWNNKCMYVDARDIQSESGGIVIGDEQYRELLLERGEEKVQENKQTRVYDCSFSQKSSGYMYGRDFFLGDKITVRDKTLGIFMDVYVLGAIKTFSDGVWMMDFVFSDGFYKPFDIINQIKRNENHTEIAMNGLEVK